MWRVVTTLKLRSRGYRPISRSCSVKFRGPVPQKLKVSTLTLIASGLSITGLFFAAGCASQIHSPHGSQTAAPSAVGLPAATIGKEATALTPQSASGGTSALELRGKRVAKEDPLVMEPVKLAESPAARDVAPVKANPSPMNAQPVAASLATATQAPAELSNPPSLASESAKPRSQGISDQTQPPSGNSPWVGEAILAAVVVCLIVAWSYGHSEPVRARRKLQAIVDGVEDTLAGLGRVSQELQEAIAGAAADYGNEVRRSYLRAIALDDVRRLTPGVRLQPLYAQGIRNLLDCQEWNAGRLLQLRGIGADSASRIAEACQALTRQVERQPIPHPRITDGSAAAICLYAKIYVFGKAQALLRGQKEAVERVLETLRRMLGAVEIRVTFLRWLVGSKARGGLKEAIDLVSTAVAESSAGQTLGKTLAEAADQLGAAKALSQSPISHEDLMVDAVANEDFYRTALTNFLGPTSGGTVGRAVTAGQRSLPVEAATEPVPVGVPPKIATGFSIQGPGGLRIELRSHAGGFSGRAYAGATAARCWLPPDKDVTVGGYFIRGGMVYVGHELRSVNQGTVEPALIDAAQPIQRGMANCQVRMLTYWSNYSYATPAARASYLQWLATGRADPGADIGYVFLYFYGLERRALCDAENDPAAKAEVPTIVAEVRRLRSIYGSNHSFARYSADFLEYLEVTQPESAGEGVNAALPALERYRLSFDLRRRLGSIAASGDPLPANLAYIWFHNDPRSRLPAVVTRCPREVASLFELEYRRRFGEGLILPKNKTKLKLTYKPASASFGAVLVGTVDLPDVAVLSTTYSKLESVALECSRLLEGYGRFVARNSGQERSLDALVLLPACLWPERIKMAMEAMKQVAQESGRAHTVKFSAFLKNLPPGDLTKSKFVSLCRALGDLEVGIEPDVRFGGQLPSGDDPVAVFAAEATEKTTEGFGSAALMVHLASIVAFADGDFSEPEAQKLREHIEREWDLAPAEQQRLLARMATFRLRSPPTTGLKKMVEALDDRMRAAVLDLLLAMAYADGVLAPTEVRALEKIYRLFEIEPSSLYTRLHDLAARPEGAPRAPRRTKGPIQLDRAKVEQLMAESAEATRRLTVIFDTEGAEQSGAEAPEPTPAPAEPTLLGLDAAHAGLLAVLLERPEWTRPEFEELCADKGLMPDGAIETINEAAFARFDQPVIEGDDTLEINTQLLLEEKAA